MENTKIQWTDHTWNVAVGCTKVDEDCKYCYMYRGSLEGTRYDPKVIRKTKSVFNLPLKIKEPSRIFTSSLTDVFHEGLDDFRIEMWDIIRKCPKHTFQILTKRPERILDNLPKDWGDGWKNVWIGTSVGSNESIERIWHLLKARGKVHTMFVSLEPLWGPVYLDVDYFPNRLVRALASDERTKLLHLLDWVIVGGESGNENGKYKYRPCQLDWIQDIVQQCKTYKVPVFVKQLGTHLAKELRLKERHGGDIEEFPLDLQIRQFPLPTIH